MGISRCLTERPIPMRPRSILTGYCRKKDRPSLRGPMVTLAPGWTCRRITQSPGECRCRERSRPTPRLPCRSKIICSLCCKRCSVANKRLKQPFKPFPPLQFSPETGAKINSSSPPRARERTAVGVERLERSGAIERFERPLDDDQRVVTVGDRRHLTLDAVLFAPL